MSHGSVSLMMLVSPALFAQSLVGSGYADLIRKAFDAAPSAAPLVCSVTPVSPLLDFSLRFHTGYVIKIPLGTYQGARHKWVALLRVTPKDGGPVYFAAGLKMPNLPAQVDTNGEVWGGFLVGEGRYRVELLVVDDLHRVCQNQWQIRTTEPGGARHADLAIAPGAVQELGSELSPRQPPEDAPIERLTILVQAAPLLRSHSTLQNVDIAALAEMSTLLLAKLPARSVRLVVFNLAQQAVLFRSDPPARFDVHAAIQAMRKLQLAEISYGALRDPLGSAALLDSLVWGELLDARPSGVVVFLGPRIESPDISRESLVRSPQGALRFFYVQYAPLHMVVSNPTPMFRADMKSIDDLDDDSEQYLPAPAGSDGIEHVVKSLKGETIVVRKPADLGSAIRRITRAIAADRSVQ
ncbi:MAG TPA: hypothetical protein VMJ75_24010 [Candidatus Acidoferrales bacterium]|nr:hypothetical protein [Candidatus Acidoferrales bacterium]